MSQSTLVTPSWCTWYGLPSYAVSCCATERATHMCRAGWRHDRDAMPEKYLAAPGDNGRVPHAVDLLTQKSRRELSRKPLRQVVHVQLHAVLRRHRPLWGRPRMPPLAQLAPARRAWGRVT